MAASTLNVRRRFIVVEQAGIEWSVALSQSAIDEGGAYDLSVSADLGAYVPSAGEMAYITLTTITPADFATLFPGETQTVSADMVTGYTAPMKAAIEALGGTGVVTTVNGITGIILGFKIDTFTSVQITRTTVDRAGDQGDRRSVHQILNPSNGTVLAGIDSCVINDISVPPVGAEIATGELSNYYMDVLITSPGTSPPNDTLIGNIVGKDAGGNVVALTAATMAQDSSGRFKITGTAPNFAIRTTGVLADFQQDAVEGVNPKPRRYYDISANLTAGGNTILVSWQIKPNFPHVNPTGWPTVTDNPTTGAALYSALRVATNRRVDMGNMADGVHDCRNLTQLKPILRNTTIVGYPEICIRNGVPWLFREGDNVVVEGVSLRAGMPTLIRNIDCFVVGEGANDWVRNYHLRHISCSSNNDETFRVNDQDTTGFACRHVRISWSMFYEAFHSANHEKGNQHNHGPDLSGRCFNVGMDHNIICSNDTRNPQIGRKILGVWVVNNLIAHWLNRSGAMGGGICVIGSTGGLSVADERMVRLERNLFNARVTVGTQNPIDPRLQAIRLDTISAPLADIYIPANSNHFIDLPTDSFEDDPLTVGDGIAQNGCSADFTVNSAGPPPFTWDSAFENELHPTATEANRRALITLLFSTGGPRGIGAGNGCQYDQDIKGLLMAGTTRMNVKPPEHDARYGPLWDGVGGSLGHGVAV